MDRKEAIELIVSNFDITKEKRDEKSFYIEEDDSTASFFFDKRQYLRGEVVAKLVELFNGVNIIDGQCRIDPLTLLWTTVYIEKRQ